MTSIEKSVFEEKTVPIFLFLGFVGSGKSTISSLITKYLNSIGCKAYSVDGDNLFNLSMTNTLRLGQERQPLTIWEIAQTIIQGAVPVVSSGGGVFINYKTKSQLLSDHLKKFFPEHNFVFYTFVPSKNGVLAIQPITVSYIEELKSIYNKETDSRVPDVVKARIKRGEWDSNAKIPIIIKISKGNFKFAKEFIQNSFANFTFPIVESSMYNNGVFSETIDTSVLYGFREFSFTVPEKVYYHQTRILADFGQPKMGHITMQFVPYSEEPAFIYSSNYSWNTLKASGRIIQTEMVIPNGIKPPKKTSSFILVKEDISNIFCCDKNDNSEVQKTHVTLNPTNFHYPKQMGDIAIALNSDKTFVDLKSKNGDTIRHNLKAISKYPEVTGKLDVLFYIP